MSRCLTMTSVKPEPFLRLSSRENIFRIDAITMKLSADKAKMNSKNLKVAGPRSNLCLRRATKRHRSSNSKPISPSTNETKLFSQSACLSQLSLSTEILSATKQRGQSTTLANSSSSRGRKSDSLTTIPTSCCLDCQDKLLSDGY